MRQSGASAISYYEQIALGGVAGAVPWMKSGYNPDVGTSYEDLCLASSGGTYVWPAAAQQMEVLSTGAGAGNDTAAGTGVQQVRLRYLDASFVEKYVTLTMNAGTPVPTGVADIYRIQSFRAWACGATNPKAAAGTIIVRTLGGGTTYTEMAVGTTRARNSCWTVPAGKKLVITSIAFSSGSSSANKHTVITTRATYDDMSQRLLGANFFMPYHEMGVQDQGWYRELEIPTIFPATVDLKVSAIGFSAGAACTSVMRGYVQTL